MLEQTILFSVFSLFLLALYFRMAQSHSERERDPDPQRNQVAGIEKLFRKLIFAFAIISLVTAFWSSMLGEPTEVNVANYTVGSFYSNTTKMNGVDAWNYTNQSLPYITGVVKSTNTIYSTSQFNFLLGLYRVIVYILFFFALLLSIIWAIQFFGNLREAGKKPPRGGWNGQR